MNKINHPITIGNYLFICIIPHMMTRDLHLLPSIVAEAVLRFVGFYHCQILNKYGMFLSCLMTRVAEKNDVKCFDWIY